MNVKHFLWTAATSVGIFFWSGMLVAGWTSEISTIEVQDTENLLSDIDTVAETALELFNVPGTAIGVIVDGNVVLSRGYGLRDQKKGLPVTDSTLFAIGSCTKAFTAFVLGTLVEEGRITWDDPVIKHLPEFRLWDQHATHKITIRDLVSHRSGLPRHDFVWYNSELSMSELLPRLEHLEPVCDLREKFHYNNLMFVVAGLVIERVTGQSWEENVRNRIFTPLEMLNSNFSVEESKLADDHSKPYSEAGGSIQEIPFRNITNVGPAGAINSNISDMLRWLQVHFSEQHLIKQETLREMHTLQIPCSIFSNEKFLSLGYGLGWCIGMYDGHYVVEHGGGIDGFISRVVFLPKEKIGLVILTNNSSAGGLLVTSLGNLILDRLLKSEEIDWLSKMNEIREQMKSEADGKEEIEESETSPAHPLEDYIGNYEHPGYGTVSIFMENGQLFAAYNRISTPLKHKNYDVFSGSKEAKDPVFAGLTFSFISDFTGEIASLEIPFEPAVSPIHFKKMPLNELLSIDYLKRFEGEYVGDHSSVKIQLRGNQLIAVLPGQPEYVLIPEKRNVFTLKGIPGYRVSFIAESDGSVIELHFVQPNGVFKFKAKEEQKV